MAFRQRQRLLGSSLLLWCLAIGCCCATVTFIRAQSQSQSQPSTSVDADADAASSIRFATFNAALSRNNPGDLITDLSTSTNSQAISIAEIIQIVRPDVLLMNEFDYDPDVTAASLFQQNYLQISQNGQEPIEYDHVYVVPSNTGIPSGVDLDNNNSTDDPNDAFGFGFFPGQYAFCIFSVVSKSRITKQTKTGYSKKQCTMIHSFLTSDLTSSSSSLLLPCSAPYRASVSH